MLGKLTLWNGEEEALLYIGGKHVNVTKKHTQRTIEDVIDATHNVAMDWSVNLLQAPSSKRWNFIFED